MIVYRHPVHAALSLVLTLFGVAVHFVAMEAHFLAAVQVIVYAGAIVVLFLFVIMLLGVDEVEDLRIEPLSVQRPLAVVASLGIVGLLLAAILAARDVPGLQAGVGLDVDGGTATPDRHRRQHQAAEHQPVRRPRARLRAHVGAVDRGGRRHRGAHPQGQAGEVVNALLAWTAPAPTPTWYLVLGACCSASARSA